jgi:hypothetical protein
MAAEPGDKIMVATAQVLGPRAADADVALRRCRRLGVEVQVVGDAGQAGGAGPQLEELVSLDRNTRSVETRAAMAKLRQQGMRRSRYPKLGYRFVWANGGWAERVRPKEMATIAKVVEWKHRGWSWSAIAEHLSAHGCATATGGAWDPRRLQRAYQLAIDGQLPVEITR